MSNFFASNKYENEVNKIEKYKSVKLPEFIIILKSKKWIFFNEKIKCNDYSPFWIIHSILGHTELNIRTFNIITDKINIIPYNNILKIIHKQGANDQLIELNNNIEKESQNMESRKEQIRQQMENYKKGKNLDVA